MLTFIRLRAVFLCPLKFLLELFKLSALILYS
uniref:Uncharacterized protein n=1 Tax=Podoviridae sp. ctlMy11 TaxID=2827746 RepID=A0A8S5TCI8_9CAUD|nr:MAG TPA: hypothetical protein [Podoviridae sp. ctlMy11]